MSALGSGRAGLPTAFTAHRPLFEPMSADRPHSQGLVCSLPALSLGIPPFAVRSGPLESWTPSGPAVIPVIPHLGIWGGGGGWCMPPRRMLRPVGCVHTAVAMGGLGLGALQVTVERLSHCSRLQHHCPSRHPLPPRMRVALLDALPSSQRGVGLGWTAVGG